MADTTLYAQEYQDALKTITPAEWARWEANKDTYYKMCKPAINYAVAHYIRCAPLDADDVEGTANLIFCIACLRWDPNGDASLPTYVSNQLRRLSNYEVRRNAKHKGEVTSIVTDEGTSDILSLVGAPDEDHTLREYVELAGADALELYDKWNFGDLERKSKMGNKRPLTAAALMRSKKFEWQSLARYEGAIKSLQHAMNAWSRGENFRGVAKAYSKLEAAAV